MRQVTILRLRQTLPRTISYHRVKLASTGNRFLRSWTHVPPGRPSWRQLGRTYLDFQRTDSNPQCGDSKSSQTDCFAGPGTGPDLLSTPPHQRIQDDQSKDSADRQEQWLHDVKKVRKTICSVLQKSSARCSYTFNIAATALHPLAHSDLTANCLCSHGRV